MSIFSNEEENELINFENLEILDLFGSDSEIESAECFDINNDKKKLFQLKRITLKTQMMMKVIKIHPTQRAKKDILERKKFMKLNIIYI